MFSLEFDLHTLILKDLAANVGQAKDPAVLDSGMNLLGSRVELRAPQEQKPPADGTTEQERVFMVSRDTSPSSDASSHPTTPVVLQSALSHCIC